MLRGAQTIPREVVQICIMSCRSSLTWTVVTLQVAFVRALAIADVSNAQEGRRRFLIDAPFEERMHPRDCLESRTCMMRRHSSLFACRTMRRLSPSPPLSSMQGASQSSRTSLALPFLRLRSRASPWEVRVCVFGVRSALTRALPCTPFSALFLNAFQ